MDGNVRTVVAGYLVTNNFVENVNNQFAELHVDLKKWCRRRMTLLRLVGPGELPPPTVEEEDALALGDPDQLFGTGALLRSASCWWG